MEHIKLFLLIGSFLFPLALSFALFFDSRRNLSRKIMAGTLLNTAIIYLLNYFYVQHEYTIYVPLHGLHAGLEFLIYPAMYLYLKSVIIEDRRLKHELWHFLPGVIMTIVACGIFFVYVGSDDLTYFLKNNRLGVDFAGEKYYVLKVARYIDLGLVALQGVLYSIAFVRAPKHYNERLRNEFSNIENFSVDWVNKYNLSFASVGVFGFLIYAVFPLKGYSQYFILFIFFIMSAFVCAMGVVSLRQQKPDFVPEESECDNPKPIESDESWVVDFRLVEKLEKMMDSDRIFLQSDLTLTQLCKEMGTNRTYLSSLINRQYGVNFNTYINQYRVNYINEYIANNPGTDNDDLVQIGGFGSVSSMKRAMKRAE